MKAVLQRVSNASVEIQGKTVGRCGKGLLILLGVAVEDTKAQAEKLAGKIAGLRIFEDDGGKLNRSLLDIGGDALVISNFTLYADCKSGRRPSFVNAAGAEKACPLYEYFVERLKAEGIANCDTGRFGADMKVSLINDGPVTIVLNTDEL